MMRKTMLRSLLRCWFHCSIILGLTSFAVAQGPGCCRPVIRPLVPIPMMIPAPIIPARPAIPIVQTPIIRTPVVHAPPLIHSAPQVAHYGPIMQERVCLVPQVETAMIEQPVIRYREQRERRYRDETHIERVPVTRYYTRTEIEERRVTRRVPYDVVTRVPEYATSMIPDSNIVYEDRIQPYDDRIVYDNFSSDYNPEVGSSSSIATDRYNRTNVAIKPNDGPTPLPGYENRSAYDRDVPDSRYLETPRDHFKSRDSGRNSTFNPFGSSDQRNNSSDAFKRTSTSTSKPKQFR